MIPIIVFSIIETAVFIYYLVVRHINDFSYPIIPKRKIEKINTLFIFPHPDDELMASAGLINILPKENVFVVSVTKGEKGKEKLNLDDKNIAIIREKEFAKALKRMNVCNFEMWDIADGKVNDNHTKITEMIENFIKTNKIKRIITFERNGIYGHIDHVALSFIVNKIDNMEKWFLTQPKKVEAFYNISKHIKNVKLVKEGHSQEPEFRINILTSIIRKYYALRAYKSQNLSHKFPLLVKVFVMPFEYYTTKWKD